MDEREREREGEGEREMDCSDLNLTEMASNLESLQKLLTKKAVHVDDKTFAKASLTSEQAPTMKTQSPVSVLESSRYCSVGKRVPIKSKTSNFRKNTDKRKILSQLSFSNKTMDYPSQKAKAASIVSGSGERQNTFLQKVTISNKCT